MLRQFWSRLARRKQPDFPPGPYRAYTTAFDAELQACDLPAAPGSLGEMGFGRTSELYEQALASWRVPASIQGMESLERVVAVAGARPLGNAVVSLLVDHSGSMRGQRAILALTLVEFLTDYFLRLGAKVEVLGYTTRSWRGGQSRQSWRRAGRPKNPGRLCDLLHIVYREAGDSHSGLGWGSRNMLRDELLKENIDGEAVAWACARLRSRPEPRKILIGISDGAPVDDSTLSENPANYLDSHMQEIMAAIAQAGDIEPVGIGIDHDLTRYYARFVRVTTLADYAERVLPFLESIVTRTNPPADPALH